MVSILLIILALILDHWWPIVVAIVMHLVASWEDSQPTFRRRRR